MIKQIPNIFTLLNLFFGCCAIVCILQNGYVVNNEDGVNGIISLPSKFAQASIFISIAAAIDFLDGFVARLLKATSDLGKQLDSLADVVSFGVAPSLIVYQFLRMCYAQEVDGLQVNTFYLSFSFLIACAGAYRLGRFNIDNKQTIGFKGVPIPAMGLCIASFPLVYFYPHSNFVDELLLNKWFWYAVILVSSYLMISNLPMLALKFKGISFFKLLPFIIILLIGIISYFFVGWLSVNVGFIAYIICSLIFNDNK